MLMVGVDAADVERLRPGELACPACGDEVRPWASGRPRRLRRDDDIEYLALRRGRCRGCGVTHLLLPVCALRRRLDTAETIVRAVLAHARGVGHRRVAIDVDRPETTVRDWLRRVRQLAVLLREYFTLLGHERFGCDLRLGPSGTALGDAVNVIGVVAREAVLHLGPAPLAHFVSVRPTRCATQQHVRTLHRGYRRASRSRTCERAHLERAYTGG